MTRTPNRGSLERRLAAALGAVFWLCASMPSAAQTVDAPLTVCAGERFGVEWTGENRAGDMISIARQQNDADEFFDSAPTADGNPATLRAPIETGIYDVRYVQGGQEILVREDIFVEQCLSSGGGGEEEYPSVAALYQGTQIDYGDEIDTSESTYYGPAGLTIEQFCQASEPYGRALGMIVDQIEAEMQAAGAPVTLDSLAAMSGAPTRASIEQSMRYANEEICDQPPPQTTTQAFVITYAYCRMTMTTPTQRLDIHLPPGGGVGTMSIADHATRKVMTMSLQPSIDQVSNVIGKGWDEGLSMSGPSATSTRIGYPVGSYKFQYEMGLGGSENPMGMLGQTIKVRNEGTAWISSEVPGIDIVKLFYERLTTEMSPQGDSMSFFGGLISNIVAMLQYGLPLEMDQTTSSKALGAIGVKGRSEHYITGVELLEFGPGWCSASLMPTDYEVTDIDQELAQAMGGADSAEMSDAMRQYNEAMGQITPEQREMMERMGMGDMIGQAMGSAGAGGSTPGGGTTAPPNSACNAVSSRELTTSNMLQTVQKHLEALGYDPGNTNGDESFMTTIAISQFQAEKGIEATGEVTPQLLGILAAEVDSRC